MLFISLEVSGKIDRKSTFDFIYLQLVKVLLLHQYFNTPYTGGAIRSYYLARALVDKGMEPIVVTHYNQRDYRKEMIEGIEVHYLPITYHNRFGFFKRSLSYLRYIWLATRLVATFRNIDICYAISVPLTVGIAARRIQSRCGIPFIFEVGDLWPDAPVQMGFIRNRLFSKALYRLERKIYESARSIVALSPAIESAVRKKVPEKKIYLVPNMSDTDFFRPAAKDPVLARKFGVEGKFVIAYAGAIGIANGLEHIVLCAKATAEARLPVHFLICGDGARVDELKKMVHALNLGNFSILPLQNREGVKEILNVSDAVFVSYKPVPVLETGSPNKFFDGLAAGKLIIVNFSGWILHEIEDRCGIFVDPKNPQDFPEKITPFLKDRGLLQKFQKNARDLAEKSYSRKALSAKFAAIFENPAPPGNHS
jgi:glycosyltransferase involved in cell wall biosynthesis